MAKGKTNQPLRIGIPQEWLREPLFEELESKGHILVLMDPIDVDVVFGPNVHMMTLEMAQDTKLLPVALKAARKRKKSNA